VSSIKCLRLISDRSYTICQFVNNNKYSFSVVTTPYYRPAQEVRVISRENEKIIYPGYFYLSTQGWDYIYEINGDLFYSNELPFYCEHWSSTP